ncbi:MAG: VanW family protein [bacterium]|nr:VanW family protein [bacterium]
MKIRSQFFKQKKVKITILLVGVLLVLSLLAFAGYSVAYGSKVFPNQYLDDLNLNGKTKVELATLIKKTTEDFQKSTITLKNLDTSKIYAINPAEISLNYDVDETVNQIWAVGRNKRAFQALRQQFRAIFRKNKHASVLTLNIEGLNKKVAAIATELDQPEKDYSIFYKDGKFNLLTDRTAGKRIDQGEIIANVKTRISNVKTADYSFALKNYSPQITTENANKVLDQANKILTAGELTLKTDNASFTIDRDTIGGFIISKGNGDDLNLVLNTDRVAAYITALATSINVDPKDAKLTTVNGKVSVFQLSQVGKNLDATQTRQDIESALFTRINDGTTAVDSKIINLKIAVKQPDVSSDAISQYGINEIVGTATTSFAKSPSNRIHNITIGASAINGVLLKPGEEFSTLDRLGKIDGSTGYLPELVIKDNKTIPEFGGGLCQVSTTLFRSALNSGMKITARTNHAYRVSYYEPPAGMDATIYNPAPDFKFINNYSSYILIQSQITGTKLTFTFYGTKDGRSVIQSTPSVTNYVEPPPPVETVSAALQPGQRQLTGHAHQGATADFHYTVKSTSGEVLQDKNFHSVYVAIAEQWLVGPPVTVPATCTDGVQSGDEIGVDCGGSCPTQCPAP